MNNDGLGMQPLDGVEVRRSCVHGQGVFATRLLQAGEQIGCYAGRRYAPDHVEDAWNDRLTYIFGLSDGSMIDGAQGGNATRHLNHACVPNVEAIEEYDESDKLVINICATRRIAAGEELFLDYALEVEGDDPAAYPCACVSTQCRGTLVATRSRPD
ncbi:MAG: SET domain-containing protein-lysine N-methyltransferase [Burkholderiales bacterium]